MQSTRQSMISLGLAALLAIAAVPVLAGDVHDDRRRDGGATLHLEIGSARDGHGKARHYAHGAGRGRAHERHHVYRGEHARPRGNDDDRAGAYRDCHPRQGASAASREAHGHCLHGVAEPGADAAIRRHAIRESPPGSRPGPIESGAQRLPLTRGSVRGFRGRAPRRADERRPRPTLVIFEAMRLQPRHGPRA